MSDPRQELKNISQCITNSLDAPPAEPLWFAGVIGDTPSQYSKSPVMWNAAFSLLNLDAVYLPFDVPSSRLKAFAAALQESEHLLGVNVTVPYKIEIINYLDAVDPGAARIGAVNTVRRERDGRLIGYNTD